MSRKHSFQRFLSTPSDVYYSNGDEHECESMLKNSDNDHNDVELASDGRAKYRYSGSPRVHDKSDKKYDSTDDNDDNDHTLQSFNGRTRSPAQELHPRSQRKKVQYVKICVVVIGSLIVGFLIGYFTRGHIYGRSNSPPVYQQSHGENWSISGQHNSCYFERKVDGPSNICEKGSKQVQQCNKPLISKHTCGKCDDEFWMPLYCFCDNEAQCSHSNKDAPRKKSCNECKKDNVSCPCFNGGKCECDENAVTAEDLRCRCLEGYTGQYCQHQIKYGICFQSSGKQIINNKSSIVNCKDDKYFTCRNTTDKRDIEDLPKCPPCVSSRYIYS